MKNIKSRGMLKRPIIFLILILLIIFVDIFSTSNITKLRGFKKIISVLLMSTILGYAIILRWDLTIPFAILLTLTSYFLDVGRDKQRSLYFEERRDQLWENFKEEDDNKSLKPAGDMVKDKGDVGIAKTDDKDETRFDDEDLDKILEKDEKDSDTNLPGLKDLNDLLESAKKESPYYEENQKKKKTKDYTPAEAQRTTFHLIDTVKQLKETMTSMMPLMKVGNNLIKLHKNIGGDELQNALKN